MPVAVEVEDHEIGGVRGPHDRPDGTRLDAHGTDFVRRATRLGAYVGQVGLCGGAFGRWVRAVDAGLRRDGGAAVSACARNSGLRRAGCPRIGCRLPWLGACVRPCGGGVSRRVREVGACLRGNPGGAVFVLSACGLDSGPQGVCAARRLGRLGAHAGQGALCTGGFGRSVRAIRVGLCQDGGVAVAACGLHSCVIHGTSPFPLPASARRTPTGGRRRGPPRPPSGPRTPPA